jgi:peptidoglycan-associated lipoprotein
MSYKLVASLATLVALTACESTEETRSGMHDWPNSSASVDGPVPGSAADFKQKASDTVYFDLNKSNITADSQATLEKQAAWAKEYPSVNFIVEGHCDERGTTEYNMALGEKRAHSAKKSLAAAGVDASRLETVSYGKERPVATGTGEEVWKQNRRAVTVVR